MEPTTREQPTDALAFRMLQAWEKAGYYPALMRDERGWFVQLGNGPSSEMALSFRTAGHPTPQSAIFAAAEVVRVGGL